jgi:hypothetical protein
VVSGETREDAQEAAGEPEAALEARKSTLLTFIVTGRKDFRRLGLRAASTILARNHSPHPGVRGLGAAVFG